MGDRQYACKICGELGHNRSTCPRAPEPRPIDEELLAEAERLTPKQKLIKLLEEQMLQGRTQKQCQKWAIGLGLPAEKPDDLFFQMWTQIKNSWQSNTLTFADFCDKRDTARARFNDIYNRALACGDGEHQWTPNYQAALRALEGIIKLDGLEAPGQVEITVAAAGQITNSTRDNVMRMIERMKQLAASREAEDPKIGAAIARLEAANGHGNGHAVIDVDPDPKDGD